MADKLPLDQFLNRFSPQSAESWDELAFSFTHDDVEHNTIEALRAELRQHGSFREDIRVDYEAGTVANGQHRVIAAILEDLSELSFTDKVQELEYPVHESRFVLSETELTETKFDQIAQLLRSFPVTERFWVECDASASGGDLYLSFEAPEELKPHVDGLIRQRLQILGVTAVLK